MNKPPWGLSRGFQWTKLFASQWVKYQWCYKEKFKILNKNFFPGKSVNTLCLKLLLTYRNIRPSLRCPCTIDWQFSRPARLIFPSGTSRPIGNIHTHRMRVERFSWAFRAGPPSPLACPPLARPFFLGPATQATSSAFCGFKSTACTKKMYHSNIFCFLFFSFLSFLSLFFSATKTRITKNLQLSTYNQTW